MNGCKMTPIYDPRVADLVPGDFLEVRCACGNEALIPQSALLQKLRLRRDDRIADLGLRLRCRECGERGKVMVSVRWAQPDATL
jgi:ribosomal protein S27E